jgi:hypothetical protein
MQCKKSRRTVPLLCYFGMKADDIYLKSQILGYVSIVFWILAFLTQMYIRGIFIFLICVCYVIDAIVDPNARVFSFNREGSWLLIKKKTLAIVSVLCMVLYWIIII